MDWMKQVHKGINTCEGCKEWERPVGSDLLSGGIRCRVEYYNSHKGFRAFNLLQRITGKEEAGKHGQTEYII